MKIEMWYDFSEPLCYAQIEAIDQLLKRYKIEELELFYRSYEVEKNTLSHDMHRLSHLAKKYHAQHEVTKDLFELVMQKGLDSITHDDLKRVAMRHYLDEKHIEDLLNSTLFHDAVISNYENAQLKRIKSVPHVRIEGKIKLNGVTHTDELYHQLSLAQAIIKDNEHCEGEHCGRKKT